MASNFEDPTEWRLKTRGNIPYKLVQVNLDYETTRASGSLDIIIMTSDLKDFLEEILPEPKQVSNIYIPQYEYFGDTLLAVVRVSVKSFSSDMPIDPFGDDEDAPEGTYYPTLALTLELAVPPDGELDADKPETFLEISSDASGDFIHSGGESAAETVDVDSLGRPVDGAEKVKIRNPNVPLTVLCPQVNWSVKWKSIPFDNYKDVLVPRLEAALGKVNKEPFAPLTVTTKETLLMLAYSYERCYTWRARYTDKPMVDLSMKFLEKRVVWDGKPHGHNSFWIPGTGWRYVLMGGKPTFESYDFNRLFKPAPNFGP